MNNFFMKLFLINDNEEHRIEGKIIMIHEQHFNYFMKLFY